MDEAVIKIIKENGSFVYYSKTREVDKNGLIEIQDCLIEILSFINKKIRA